MNLLKVSFFGVLILVEVVGCSKKKEEEETEIVKIDSSFLTTDDLKTPTSLKTTTKTQMISHMSSTKETKELYANAPSSDDESSSFSDCLGERLDAYPASASGEKLTLGGIADFSSCLKEVFNDLLGSSAKVTSADAKMSLYAEFTCIGADLSEMDGQKFGELRTNDKYTDLCGGGKSGTILLNIKFTTDVDVSASGRTFSFASEFKGGIFGPDGLGCSMTSTSTDHTYLECIDFSRNEETKNTADSSEVGEVDFEKVTKTNIIENEDKTSVFFNSGSIDYIVNGWSGQITYTGAGTAPSYSMTDGIDTVTGTLSTSANSLTEVGRPSLTGTKNLSLESVAAQIAKFRPQGLFHKINN